MPNKFPLIDCLALVFVEYGGSDLELICVLKTLINFDYNKFIKINSFGDPW